MSRPSLSIFAGIVAGLVLPPMAASSQGNPAAERRFSTHWVEPAAPDLPASSSSSATSSSAPTIFDAPAQSSLSTQSAPVARPSGGGAGPFSGLAVGVKFGSAGVGFDVATPLVGQRLNLRGGASFFSYSPSTISVDSLNINGSLRFRNADVMADFFPFRGWFRLSGGMTIYNNTSLNAILSVPNGQSISVGGNTYYSDPSAPLAGTGVFNFGGKTAGRVSIGTGNMLPSKGRFAFQSEVGVQFFSQPTVAYTFSGQGCTDTTYTDCGAIPAANIVSEQNKLQNDLTDLRFFPVLSIGLSYRIH